MTTPAATTLPRTTTPPLTNVHMRATEGDQTGRAFTGTAVPWSDVIEVWGVREQFAPGSITPDPEGVLILWRHDEPIGVVTDSRDTSTGWEVDAALSDTPRGQEVATLLRDGVVTKLSIRFIPQEWTTTTDPDTGEETTTYTRAVVNEVSVVPFPAYTNARISQVRHNPAHEGAPMSTDTTTAPAAAAAAAPANDVAQLREDLAHLTRTVDARIADTSTRTAEASPLDQFRSAGDYVKALASRDEAAVRAFEGAVSGNLILPQDNAWAGDLFRIIEDRQKVTRAFTYDETLPKTGMNVDHGVLLEDTVKVSTQVNEGDLLPMGYFKIGNASAPVHTLGGATSMSVQAIDRSPRNVVDLWYKIATRRFAAAVNNLTVSQLRTFLGTAAATATTIDKNADSAIGYDELVDLFIALATKFDDTDHTIDGAFVGSGLFKALTMVPEERRALQVVGAPDNKLGTLSITVPEANISGMKIQLLPKINTAAGGQGITSGIFYDRTAIRTQVSPGAPFQLQDTNVLNLTRDFSVYGYGSSWIEDPAGLAAIKIAS